jgi:hypothetical protein
MQNIRGKFLNLGCLRYCPMDDAGHTNITVDRSANATNGLYVGGAIPKANEGVGRIRPSLSGVFFDGTNDTVNLGSASDIDNLTTFTYNFWARPSGVATRLLTKGTKVKIVILNTTGKVRVFVDHGTTNLRNDSAVSLPLSTSSTQNVWTMVTCTWDGSTTAANALVYFNGVAVAMENANNGAGSRSGDGSTSLYIGSENNSSAFFAGHISEVSVFGKVLTAAEIHGVYAAYRRDNIPRRSVI